jgi:hypothetical protein
MSRPPRVPIRGSFPDEHKNIIGIVYHETNVNRAGNRYASPHIKFVSLRKIQHQQLIFWATTRELHSIEQRYTVKVKEGSSSH